MTAFFVVVIVAALLSAVVVALLPVDDVIADHLVVRRALRLLCSMAAFVGISALTSRTIARLTLGAPCSRKRAAIVAAIQAPFLAAISVAVLDGPEWAGNVAVAGYFILPVVARHWSRQVATSPGEVVGAP